ncbi:hypothetical protein HAX54_016470, partial [Datura stramonium]|nr:hypothetical protein [Datura stramonium]
MCWYTLAELPVVYDICMYVVIRVLTHVSMARFVSRTTIRISYVAPVDIGCKLLGPSDSWIPNAESTSDRMDGARNQAQPERGSKMLIVAI